MTHSDLVQAIILAVSEANVARLFKNHTGIAKHKKGDRTWIVRYGVGPPEGGGGDLIGWRMDGRFISIDVKVGRDRLSASQKKWARWVIEGGGIAGEARSVEQAMEVITESCLYPGFAKQDTFL